MGRKVSADSMYDFFKSKEKERESKGVGQSGGGKSYSFVLSKGSNLGTLVCRIIPDSFGNPTKSVYNVRELWMPSIDKETGELTERQTSHSFPALDNWDNPDEISEHGKEIYQKINETLDQINDYLERPITNRKEIVYFFAKAMEFTKEGSDTPEKGFGNVRLYRSHSTSFSQALTKAILSKKKSTGSTSFLETYISRDPTPTKHMIVITTSNREAGFGFDTTVSFESEVKTAVALTDDDLKACKDLSVNDVDLTKFDEAFWERELQTLQMYLEQLDSESSDEYVEEESSDEDVSSDDEVEDEEEEIEEEDDEVEEDEDDDHL